MIFTENWHLKWVSLWIHRCQIHLNAKYQPHSKNSREGVWICWGFVPQKKLQLKVKHHFAKPHWTQMKKKKKNPWSFHNRNISSLIWGISMIYLTIWIKFRFAQYKPQGWKTQQVKKCGFFQWNNEKEWD